MDAIPGTATADETKATITMAMTTTELFAEAILIDYWKQKC